MILVILNKHLENMLLNKTMFINSMFQTIFFTVNKERFIFKTLRTFQRKICLQLGQVQLLENHFSVHARQKKMAAIKACIALPTVTSSRHTPHLSPSSDRSTGLI